MASRQRDKWAFFAACKDMSPEEADKIFFDVKPGRPALIQPYEKICGNCPVCKECFDWALVHNVEGVWGNSSKGQRNHPFLKEYKQVLTEQAEAEGWLESYPVFYGVLLPTEDQVELVEVVSVQFLLDFEIEVQLHISVAS